MKLMRCDVITWFLNSTFAASYSACTAYAGDRAITVVSAEQAMKNALGGQAGAAGLCTLNQVDP
jgi:hypothetical protein